MGKRTTIEKEDSPSGKEIRTPANPTIKTFNSTYDAVNETIIGANDKLKLAADVAKKKHLGIAAYKAVKKLYDGYQKAKNQSIAAEKLATFLANFDKMREYFKLDELANLQGRMLKVGEIGSSGEPVADEDESEHPDPDATDDDDDAKDFRPGYLKQPGASVTSGDPNPVRELADKAGAKIPGNPIDQVGRGQPKLN